MNVSFRTIFVAFLIHQSRMRYKCHLTYCQSQKLKTCLLICFLPTDFHLLLLDIDPLNSFCSLGVLGLARKVKNHKIIEVIIRVGVWAQDFSLKLIMIQKSNKILQENLIEPQQFLHSQASTRWSKFYKYQKLCCTFLF